MPFFPTIASTATRTTTRTTAAAATFAHVYDMNKMKIYPAIYINVERY